MKTKEQISKNVKNKYIEVKEKRDIQLNYIKGMLNSYRYFDEQTKEQFIIELRAIVRLNDQFYLLEEML